MQEADTVVAADVEEVDIPEDSRGTDSPADFLDIADFLVAVASPVDHSAGAVDFLAAVDSPVDHSAEVVDLAVEG